MSIPFKKFRKELLKDPEVRAEYERLRPEYEIASAIIGARAAANLTQAELAERMGTTQSAVARMESGRQMPSTKTLLRIAEATGTELRVEFA